MGQSQFGVLTQEIGVHFHPHNHMSAINAVPPTHHFPQISPNDPPIPSPFFFIFSRITTPSIFPPSIFDRGHPPPPIPPPASDLLIPLVAPWGSPLKVRLRWVAEPVAGVHPHTTVIMFCPAPLKNVNPGSKINKDCVVCCPYFSFPRFCVYLPTLQPRKKKSTINYIIYYLLTMQRHFPT